MEYLISVLELKYTYLPHHKYLLKKMGEVGCCGRAVPVHNTPHPELLKRYHHNTYWRILSDEVDGRMN